MLLPGGLDGEAFITYTRDVLLAALRTGDILVMDNRAVHRNPVARRLIEAAGGTILDSPPYSPDLNPVELIWCKIKAALCKVAARTSEARTQATSRALESVTIKDIKGWFRACGHSTEKMR